MKSMRTDVAGIVLILVAIMVLRLAAGGQYVYYVAEGMKPFLLLSGALLAVFGGYCLWQALRPAPGRAAESDDHGHSHDGAPRVAYLLLLPVLAVFVVTPSALGAYSAERQTVTSTAPAATAELPPLPAGTPELPLRDYVVRAVWDDGRTLAGKDVSMTGFVTPDPAGGWWLTRMAMTCCAADATASRIKVLGGPAGLSADTWVQLTGRWVAGGGVRDAAAIPVVQAVAVTSVPQPRNPYE